MQTQNMVHGIINVQNLTKATNKHNKYQLQVLKAVARLWPSEM